MGRNTGSDVRLPHQAVSGQHATIRSQGAGYVVEDDGSTNGTRVNGVRLPPKRPKPLRSGDVIDLGGFALHVEVGVPVVEATSVDRTSALAKRLVRQLLDPDGTAAPPPRLLVLNGPDEGAMLEIPEPPVRLLIGRGEDCDLPLQDGDASREHGEIERDLDGVSIRDLGSKNGLLVNGRPVRERRLRDRDEVQIGATVIVYEDPADSMLREVSAEPDLAMETPPPAIEQTASAPAAKEESAEKAAASEADARVSAPSPVETVPGAPERASEPEGTRAPEPAREVRRRSGAGADVIIYLLAGAVLALSIAGLVILLQAG